MEGLDRARLAARVREHAARHIRDTGLRKRLCKVGGAALMLAAVGLVMGAFDEGLAIGEELTTKEMALLVAGLGSGFVGFAALVSGIWGWPQRIFLIAGRLTRPGEALKEVTPKGNWACFEGCEVREVDGEGQLADEPLVIKMLRMAAGGRVLVQFMDPHDPGLRWDSEVTILAKLGADGALEWLERLEERGAGGSRPPSA